jgi:hypothetical protein
MFKRKLIAYVYSKYDFYHSDSSPSDYSSFVKSDIENVLSIKIQSLRLPLHKSRFNIKLVGCGRYMFVYRKSYTPPKKISLSMSNSFSYYIWLKNNLKT